MVYSDYEQVPWYRRDDLYHSRWGWTAWWFSAITVPFGSTPFVAWLATVLYTGDVYREQKDSAGHLKRWGWINKVAITLLIMVHGWLWWWVIREMMG